MPNPQTNSFICSWLCREIGHILGHLLITIRTTSNNNHAEIWMILGFFSSPIRREIDEIDHL